MFKFVQSLVKGRAFTIAGETRSLVEKIDEAFQKAKAERRNLEFSKQLLESMCHSAGGMIWRKDADHRYLFANTTHCRTFFDMQDNCTNEVVGFNDPELIDTFIERTGKIHTFKDVCIGSDDHVKSEGHQCTYIETGKIGDRNIVLKVVKVPLFDAEGNYEGSVGMALDTDAIDCACYLNKVDELLANGDAVKLDDQIVWLKKEHNQCPIVGAFS